MASDCAVTFSGKVVRDLVAQDNEQWGRPNPEMIALSRRLRSSGMRTALLSNMQPDMLAFVHERHPWLDELEPRIISCEVAEAKPEPAIFRLAAERLRLQPEDCLFVDDRSTNVEGARQMGMRAMQFESADAIHRLMELLAGMRVKLA